MSEEESAPQETQSSSWLDGVDSDYRNDPSISKHSDVNSLVREHVNAQTMIGRKGIIAPQDGDDATVYKSFRESLGIPEEASQYKTTATLPEDWDNSFGAKMAQVAHEKNVSAEAFDAIVTEYANWANEATGSRDAEANRLTQENLSALRKELGTSFEATAGLAQAALANLSNNPQEFANTRLADGTLLGDNPEFIKMLGQVGKTMQEKGMIGDKNVNTHGMTPEEAKNALNRLEGENFDKLFIQSDHPAHAELVAERDRLLAMAFPDEF
jgi:hypothetical protein